MGTTLLRYPYEVLDPTEYFEEIEDVKVTKDMLDLARHIVDQKSGSFEPEFRGNRFGRTHQPKASGQAYRAKAPSARRERSREHPLHGEEQGPEDADQKGEEGGGWPEGTDDADRRQEAGEVGSGEKIESRGAAQDGVRS
jgi:hypothetical protein